MEMHRYSKMLTEELYMITNTYFQWSINVKRSISYLLVSAKSAWNVFQGRSWMINLALVQIELPMFHSLLLFFIAFYCSSLPLISTGIRSDFINDSNKTKYTIFLIRIYSYCHLLLSANMTWCRCFSSCQNASFFEQFETHDCVSIKYYNLCFVFFSFFLKPRNVSNIVLVVLPMCWVSCDGLTFLIWTYDCRSLCVLFFFYFFVVFIATYMYVHVRILADDAGINEWYMMNQIVSGNN